MTLNGGSGEKMIMQGEYDGSPSGLWRREDGSVMLPYNLRRATLRDRLYLIGLTWRACHHVRLTLRVIWTYLHPSAQVCDYERWVTNGP